MLNLFTILSTAYVALYVVVGLIILFMPIFSSNQIISYFGLAQKFLLIPVIISVFWLTQNFANLKFWLLITLLVITACIFSVMKLLDW